MFSHMDRNFFKYKILVKIFLCKVISEMLLIFVVIHNNTPLVTSDMKRYVVIFFNSSNYSDGVPTPVGML